MMRTGNPEPVGGNTQLKKLNSFKNTGKSYHHQLEHNRSFTNPYSAALGNHQGSSALGFYIPNTLDAAIPKNITKRGKHCEALIWYGLNVQQDVEVKQLVSKFLDFCMRLRKATLHMNCGREIQAVCRNVKTFDGFLQQRAVAWCFCWVIVCFPISPRFISYRD